MKLFVWDLNKKFEFRKNDRDFQIGDIVYLQEYYIVVLFNGFLSCLRNGGWKMKSMVVEMLMIGRSVRAPFEESHANEIFRVVAGRAFGKHQAD